MSTPYKIIENGVEREMTELEVIAFNAKFDTLRTTSAVARAQPLSDLVVKPSPLTSKQKIDAAGALIPGKAVALLAKRKEQILSEKAKIVATPARESTSRVKPVTVSKDAPKKMKDAINASLNNPAKIKSLNDRIQAIYDRAKLNKITGKDRTATQLQATIDKLS